MGSIFRRKHEPSATAQAQERKPKPLQVYTICPAILCASEYEISLEYQAAIPWYQGTFKLGSEPIAVDPPLARNSAVVEALVLYSRNHGAVKLWRRGAIFGGSFSQSVPHMDLKIKVEYDPSRLVLKFEEAVDSHAW